MESHKKSKSSSQKFIKDQKDAKNECTEFNVFQQVKCSNPVKTEFNYEPIMKSDAVSAQIPFSINNIFISTESSHTCIAENQVKIENEENKENEVCKIKVEEEEDIDECNTGRWTDEEHQRFKEALGKYGKNWKKIQEYVGTRSTTQTRSHAQKYFYKMGKDLNNPKETNPEVTLEVSIKNKPENKFRSEERLSSPNFIPNEVLSSKSTLKRYGPGKTQINIGMKNVSQVNIKREPLENFNEELLYGKRFYSENNSFELEESGSKKIKDLDEPKFENLDYEVIKPLKLEEREKSDEDEKLENKKKSKFFIDLQSIFNM